MSDKKNRCESGLDGVWCENEKAPGEVFCAGHTERFPEIAFIYRKVRTAPWGHPLGRLPCSLFGEVAELMKEWKGK